MDQDSAHVSSDIIVRSAIVHRVLSSIKFRIREWHIRNANLAWSTDTDIRIKIRGNTDWIIFNELFANGEYDDPIQRLLTDSKNEPRTILDLGANVGFFGLRLAHLAISCGYRGKLFIKAIEGTPAIYKRLGENIQLQNLPDGIQIESHHGLVGLRQGVGVIYLYAMHVLNSMMRKTRRVVQVPFINVNDVTSGWESIDLLKCDIEGSELLFIQNYPDLLKKTKAAVFEFHYEMCSHEECIHLLREAGLVNREVIKQHSQSSVEYFYR